jgi:hypothetical protein
LIAGAAVFVFANRIVSFDLQKHTAADQYAAALAAQKRNDDDVRKLDQQIAEIRNPASVAKLFNDQLQGVRTEIAAFDDKLVGSCNGITFTKEAGDADYPQGSKPALDRIGEVFARTLTKYVYFKDPAPAQECESKISAHNDEITAFFRRIQDIERERDEKVRTFEDAKNADAAPVEQKKSALVAENQRLTPVVSEASKRAAEESIFGAPFVTENTDHAPTSARQTDWAQIIQSNLTRLSALAIMFFLVAVLVPQYRYNLRMAAFYDARADSIRLAGRLQPITQLQDFEKTILAMTPNIDFGKAPSTPVDQLVELIKAARQ